MKMQIIPFIGCKKVIWIHRLAACWINQMKRMSVKGADVFCISLELWNVVLSRHIFCSIWEVI